MGYTTKNGERENFDIVFDKLYYIIEEQGEDLTLHTNTEIQKIPFGKFLRDFIYAQLSAQTNWKIIENNFNAIDRVFLSFDKDRIKEHGGEYFDNELKKIRCGSRVRKAQMIVLNKNIQTLENVEKEWKGIGNYIIKNPINEVIRSFSEYNGKYKLKQMAVALVCEWLKAYVDLIKPDIHVKRILGMERLGLLNGKETDYQVIEKIKNLNSKYSLREIDNMLWEYCREGGKFEICSSNPKCNKCKISSYCNKKL